jgi:hypothetical protein
MRLPSNLLPSTFKKSRVRNVILQQIVNQSDPYQLGFPYRRPIRLEFERLRIPVIDEAF